MSATATVTTPSWGTRLRRARGWLVAAGIMVLTVAVAVLIAGRSSGSYPPLAADSPTQTGAKAVLQVLRGHGVTVRTADTLAQASRAVAAAGADRTTVAVYDPNGFLTPQRLADSDLADAAHLLLIDPLPGVTQTLAEDGLHGSTAPAGRFENGRILEGDNAARAIAALGADPTLVWYLPGAADAAVSAPPTLAELAPPWVSPVLLLAAIAAAAAAVWRGRRFGPLVVEDLPVAVPASESLEGRARLYGRSNARLHALDALRMGALGRLAGRLGLGPAASVDEITAAAAERTGLPPAQLRALLIDAVPGGDGELVELSTRLAELEAAVGRAGRPPEQREW